MSAIKQVPPCSQHAQKLNFILSLSNTMLNASVNGDWNTLIMNEAQRRPTLEAILKPSDAADLDAESKQALKRIIEIDQQIVELVTAKKDLIAAELRNIRRVKTAADAYRQNAG